MWTELARAQPQAKLGGSLMNPAAWPVRVPQSQATSSDDDDRAMKSICASGYLGRGDAYNGLHYPRASR